MQWKQRLTAPGQSDKYWIKTNYGGLNECILIDGSTGSCLPNCVGYAWGRAYEAMGKRPTLSRANAENWWGTNDGYPRGQTPRKGSIACWRKGQAGNANDGAGHVAFVEDVAANGVDFTSSNSGYQSTRFWVQNHYGSNGYNIGKNYYFQGFIYLPNIEFDKPEPLPVGDCDKFDIGDEVIVSGPLFVSSVARNASGSVKDKRTFITRKVRGTAHPYNTTGDLGWMDESSIRKVEEKPKENKKIEIGDKVRITGRLYGSSYGEWPGKYVTNLETRITRYVPGRPYPYNTTGDLGWISESSITKI